MTAPDERAIRSVAVAGAGIVGLSAALAFARALPSARVTLVALPPDPAALADRMPGSLPPIGRFHAAIGLNELQLVKSGIATHRLGTKFERWSASGREWYHVLGGTGRHTGTVGFHHLWLRAHRAGGALPYHLYSPAAALAEAGKFVHPAQNPDSLLATYRYALRLDPELYRQRLEAECRTLRIERIEGALAGIERREDGGVAALRLDGERRLEADLFLDCAGPSAPLLSAVDERFEEWGEWLPCDRLLLGSAAGRDALSPADLAVAEQAGWRWSLPLRERTLTGFAFASAVASDGEAARWLGAEAAESLSIRSGRRPEPWVRNVLALCDAAVAVDPLEAANLHLAQSAILRALELIPGRACHPLELAEYNRRTAWEMTRLRDFLALHYLRSGRTEGDFWTSLAARRPPDSLAHTLEQFERRARLPFYEEESFDRESWLAVLLGLAVIPQDADPSSEAPDPAEVSAAMKRLAAEIAALPARLPSYRDYLARMAAQR